MASSRRTRRRRQQKSLHRHQLRLEGLEKRYALNSAPLLDPTYDPTFNVVTENSGAPVGQAGTSITSLINTEVSYGSGYSDTDGDAPGITTPKVNSLSTEADTVSVVVSETEAALNFRVSLSENHLHFTWDSIH